MPGISARVAVSFNVRLDRSGMSLCLICCCVAEPRYSVSGMHGPLRGGKAGEDRTSSCFACTIIRQLPTPPPPLAFYPLVPFLLLDQGLDGMSVPGF